MPFCKLKNCPVKEEYESEHCFYGYYPEPLCWRGWFDRFIFVIRMRFSKDFNKIGKEK